MKKLMAVALLVGAFALPSSAAWGAAKPTKASHATYALGSAKKCRVGFVKRTEHQTVSTRVKVRGVWKTEKTTHRYVGCVWTVKTPAKSIAPATSTAPPTGSSSTTPAAKTDPPTDVVVTSSANPAYLSNGSVTVTYTVTVASVAIPNTTGQIELSDNGTDVSGCFPIAKPTYNGNGTFSGTCSVTYTAASTETIVGIFTGDSVFAQSAGSMTETIAASAPSAPSLGSGGGGGSIGVTSPTIALGVSLGTPNQDGTNYLLNSYSATASTTSNSSPTSVASGTLQFFADSVLVCTDAVNSTTTSGSCAVTWTTFGTHSIEVRYDDNAGHAATTGGTSEDIEPPTLTVSNSWGTTSPTNNPAVDAEVTGSTAAITVTDANFEGATSIGFSDTANDSCTATVSGTTATCSMALTESPTSFQLSYPGGTTTQTTQPIAPNGTQTLIETWPSSFYSVSSPTVNDLGATAMWQSAIISGVLDWDPGTGHGGGTVPSLPIVASSGDELNLNIGVTGNVSGEPFPIGTLDFTVTGGSYTAGGFSANGNTDCTSIDNYSSQAEGSCGITFNGTGVYEIDATFNPGDANYSSVSLPEITVDVS